MSASHLTVSSGGRSKGSVPVVGSLGVSCAGKEVGPSIAARPKLRLVRDGGGGGGSTRKRAIGRRHTKLFRHFASALRPFLCRDAPAFWALPRASSVGPAARSLFASVPCSLDFLYAEWEELGLKCCATLRRDGIFPFADDQLCKVVCLRTETSATEFRRRSPRRMSERSLPVLRASISPNKHFLLLGVSGAWRRRLQWLFGSETRRWFEGNSTLVAKSRLLLASGSRFFLEECTPNLVN